MLNKTDVSNQITGLRPKVKQAAVHLAHHLTKEIKKCQARKGPKAEKFHKKAETHRQEVIILKKIKADSVSRYALQMDFSDRVKLLGDITLPLETKVIVKLATHKSVASHIESFREQHPEWKSKLPHLLETLGIRAKFKKKVQKQQEKQERKLARKQASNDGSNKDDGEVTKQSSSSNAKVKSSGKKKSKNESETCIDHKSASDSDNQSISDGNAPGTHFNKFNNRGIQSEDDDSGDSDDSEEEEEVDEDDNKNGYNDSDDGEEDEIDEDDDKNDDSEESEEREDVNEEEEDNSESDGFATKFAEGNIKFDASNKEEKGVKLFKSNMNDHISKTAENKLAEVRRFADLLENETFMSRKGTESKSLVPKDEESSKSISDSEPVEEDTFFMTGENRFLKTTAVKRGNGEGLESSSRNARNFDEETNQWSVDGKKLKGNRAERRAKFLGRDIKKRKPRQMDMSKEFVRPAQKDQKNSTSFNKFQINTEKRVEGKIFKPKFDKQSLGGRNGKDFPKKNGNIPNSEQPSSASETLHPSWEAKRKQKVSLDNFQGKKIKFDDD